MPYDISPHAKAVVGESDLGKALLDYLAQRGMTPELLEGYTGNANGHFEYGGDLPPAGRITLQEGDIGSEGSRRTLTHELAHAADREMTKQFFGRKKSGEGDTPFSGAFDKIRLQGAGGGRSATNHHAARLDGTGGKWANDKIDYRASAGELIAHGAGNAVTSLPVNKSPGHVDATMATELAILLDLASRQRQQKK